MIRNQLKFYIAVVVLLAFVFSFSYLIVVAQNETTQSAYYQVETVILEDGTSLDKIIINGPPKPPPGFESERKPVDLATLESIDSAYTIPGVPAFNWSMGCAATSAAMIAGYFDRTTHPDIYTGPTNGGVIPLDNSVWGTWSDGIDTYGQTPLSATRQDLDGRLIKGHVDDYWVAYNSTAPDPFYGNWTEHTHGECTGDFMKTNQTTYHGNPDGGTTFYSYTSNPDPLTCSAIAGAGYADDDGTYGWKLFYESRGYTVTDCYNQKTDNTVSGGFSFADYKAEIDAGYPVMIHVEGHTMVGVGYNDTGSIVYLHDTWDYDVHEMTWGGSYQDMAMESVSIVHMAPADLVPPILNPIDNVDGDGSYLVDWTDVSNAITYTLQVDDNSSFTHPTVVYTDTASQHMVTGQNNGTYYYQVRANNFSQVSEWSNTESVTVTVSKSFVPLIFFNYSTAGPEWVNIMKEDFEGPFPGFWQLAEGGNGVYLWGKRACEVYEGSFSGWAVGGGADGSALPCGSNYPNYTYSWMVFGPFSLETALAAELNFMTWINTEVDFDYLFWGASIDGNDFYGEYVDGFSGGWFPITFDLSNVYTLGNLMGQTEVWIAYVFYGDSIFNYPNGAFIDNIVLRQCTANCPVPLATSQGLPPGIRVKETQIER